MSQLITEPVINDYQAIDDFLLCTTPKEWLDEATPQLELLLLDHAHCELKAANTALRLIFNYPQYHTLCIELSKLAREELLHFEKVMQHLEKRKIKFKHIIASRYASGLLKHARNYEPAQAIDILIIGAIIEARSCERFLALIPYLDLELQDFYTNLVRSEARHFITYLDFAKEICNEDITLRINELLEIEKTLILNKDQSFRFHSGVPA